MRLLTIANSVPESRFERAIDVDVKLPAFYRSNYNLSEYRWYQAPGQTDDMWILDIDGVRQLIVASDAPGTPNPVRAQLEAMVASLEIEPR